MYSLKFVNSDIQIKFMCIILIIWMDDKMWPGLLIAETQQLLVFRILPEKESKTKHSTGNMATLQQCSKIWHGHILIIQLYNSQIFI